MDRVDHTLQRRSGNAVVHLRRPRRLQADQRHLRARGRRRRAGRGGRAPARLAAHGRHRGAARRRRVRGAARRHRRGAHPRRRRPHRQQPRAAARVRRPRAGRQGEPRRRHREVRVRLDADELVRNADVAMYVSKHGGKGRLSHYEPQSRPRALTRRQAVRGPAPCARPRPAAASQALDADARSRRSFAASLAARCGATRAGPCQNRRLAVWVRGVVARVAGCAASSRAAPLWRARMRRDSAGQATAQPHPLLRARARK